MMEYKKPALGVKPASLAAECRIRELAEGIARNVGDYDNTRRIEEWAEEMITHIRLLERYKSIINQ